MNKAILILSPIFFLTLISISVLSQNEFSGNHYFVAPNGNDQARGTIQQPLKTIQHAIDISLPGDTISVRQGTYYELLMIDNFGIDDNNTLNIQAHKNEKVIIDGSKLDTAHSNTAGFTIRDSENIKITGFEIQNIQTDDDSFDPAGIFIRGSSKNIQIINNKIHDIANTSLSGNAHGIHVYANDPTPIENIKIQNNRLYNLTLGSSESLTLNGNVTGFLIDGNYLHNNNNIGIDIAGHYGVCDEKGCIDQARNGIISNNRVINHSSANNPAYGGDNSAPGIYVDGGRDVKIIKNYVAFNNFGISVSSENFDKTTSNVVIQGNTIKYNHKAGLVVGGSTEDNGRSSKITVKKNKFISNDTINDGYKEITLQQNIGTISFHQNTYLICGSQTYINNASKTEISLTTAKEKVRPLTTNCLK